jgi:hypothetical protein
MTARLVGDKASPLHRADVEDLRRAIHTARAALDDTVWVSSDVKRRPESMVRGGTRLAGRCAAGARRARRDTLTSRCFASVALERLRHQASVVRPVLKDVNDAHGGIGAFDAGLDQREVARVAEPELV